MRAAIAVIAGWIVGGVLLMQYLSDQSFPGWVCPAASFGVALIVFMGLGVFRRSEGYLAGRPGGRSTDTPGLWQPHCLAKVIGRDSS